MKALSSCAALAALILTAAGAPPPSAVVALRPGGTTVAFRAFAMSVFPLDGDFGQFHGTLEVTWTTPPSCHIDMQVAVASLAMDDAAHTRDVLSAELLDAADFPLLAYRGDCAGEWVNGWLTMHGETHPLALRLRRDGDTYTAAGPIRRADWGVRGWPLTAGPTVRIRFTTKLPQRS